MTIYEVRARFDDLISDSSWVYEAPHELLIAHSPAQVREVLSTADGRTREGAWAWGYVSYDAAPAFDQALQVRRADADPLPLAVFAVGPEPVRGPAVSAPSESTSSSCDWQLDWNAKEHARRLDAVRAAIAAGTVYQANLTTHLHGHVPDPVGLYARMAYAQRGAYNALLDLGQHVIVSASPELFFRWDHTGVTTQPMKGTARRGTTNRDDEQARHDLLTSAKERAENVMIVDLLRNDLARVARTGSVRVQSLLDIQRYETVWQLTSTVACRPAADTALLDLFDALFPCGSVTGAPKVAATQLTAELETHRRGVYCGAVGMLAPPGAPFRAEFSVAIRTAIVDRRTDAAVFGVGSAITWDSRPRAEYAELQAKAAILNEPVGNFQLLETLLFDPVVGLLNLDRHLHRLLDSARFFGFPADARRIRLHIADVLAGSFGSEPRRVRLLLHSDGHLVVEHAPKPAGREPVELTVDTEVTAISRWTRHKTTMRGEYEAAERRFPQADEVVLVNPSNTVMETTRSNIAVRLDDRWYTPALSSGCLPGVERQRLLDEGRLVERGLSVSDLTHNDGLAVFNSLRGWRVASLMAG